MSSVAQLLQSLNRSTAEIAEISTLPIARVTAIMEGASVTVPELRLLSATLKIPMRSFAIGRRQPPDISPVGALFRTPARDTPQDSARTIDDIAKFVSAALSVLTPTPSAPNWLDGFQLRSETFEEAERLALLFRSRFIEDPLNAPALDLAEILTEKCGVVIAKISQSHLEGASALVRGFGFIFVSPRFKGRMLFTLAHELGHLIAHHAQREGANIDAPQQEQKLRRKPRSEMFVDAFASLLLLPQQGVARALRIIRSQLGISGDQVGDIEILYLARFFGVSFDVAARRCEQLELLPTGGAASLYDALKRDYRSPEKRAADLGIPERQLPEFPTVSKNLLEPIVANIRAGQISTGWAAENFGLNIMEIFTANTRLAHEYNH